MKAYLIGGGPSAGDVDTAVLTDGVRIGINDAAFHKPCDVFFSNDHGYALCTREKIEGFAGDRHLAIRPGHRHLFRDWQASVWERVDERNPSIMTRRLSSGPRGTPGCSGYVALNLAMQLGAKRIVLIGYDFHEDYRYFFSAQPHDRIRIPEVIESFRQVAAWYMHRGIEIINANPKSAIDAFPRRSLREVLQ